MFLQLAGMRLIEDLQFTNSNISSLTVSRSMFRKPQPNFPQCSDMSISIKTDAEELKALGQAVIKQEALAVQALSSRINDSFVAACTHMLACEGRVIVIGMGKSGHIAGKIAATLASTGTPAFFVHPGEAVHGDLGMITSKDVVIALSNSGETSEILTIIPIIKRLGIPLIAMTGLLKSTLAKEATHTIDVSVEQEACPLGLAPTSSTTAALAMGDALAIALLQYRGFTEADFARAHPGGSLGRRLLLMLKDIMHTGDDLPQVTEQTPLSDALLEMSSKRLGMTLVFDQNKQLTGIFTDGDLRRALDQGIDYATTRIGEVMTCKFKTAHPDMLAAEALQLMEAHKINGLPVIDQNNQVIGVLNMHDLLRAGVM